MTKSQKAPSRRKNDYAITAFNLICDNEVTPYAAVCKKALARSHKDFLALPALDPLAYSTADEFRVDYLLKSFLSKYKGLQTGIDTRQVAFSAFEKAEEICAKTNQRLRHPKSSFVDPVIHRAQYLISRALGPLDLSKLCGQERWGPGASTDLKRSEAYLDTKMSRFPITVTRAALPFLEEAIKADLQWSALVCGGEVLGPFSLIRESVFMIEFGSRLDTVSKNAKTDRCICIEPRGNMFVQKSVGRFLRRTLKRVGIDLNDQGINQNLAEIAWADDLATIDLSMASDTIATLLIRELLPIDWYVYLMAIRSPGYIRDGLLTPFEKFSSMGNGFTFELESLIFWALAKASMADETRDLGIYGDDIILPSADAWPLITVLAWAGFTVNDDKSFIDGPFRESCGRHYFQGTDVTPIYQKEVVSDVHSHEHLRLLNRVKRYAVKHNDGVGSLSTINTVWKLLYRAVKYDWHPQIPAGTEGDDGYVVQYGDLRREKRWRKSYGTSWDITIRKVERLPANDLALYAYALRQGCVTSSPNLGGVDSRSEDSVSYQRGTRWIEPSWEYVLES